MTEMIAARHTAIRWWGLRKTKDIVVLVQDARSQPRLNLGRRGFRQVFMLGVMVM